MRGTGRALATAGVALVLGNLGTATALAGNPLRINASGRPFVWPNGGREIVYRIDPGNLGPISHADAAAQTATAFALWEGIPTSTASFVDGGVLPVDVDVTNFALFLDPPRGTVHILYDDDGAIATLIGGAAFALVNYDEERGDIASALVFLSSTLFEDPGALTFEQLLEIQVHEIGHVLGLDHTVVNRDVLLFGAPTGPAPHYTFPLPAPADSLETMVGDFSHFEPRPFLHADDRAIISTLYPERDFFATSGSITGRVRWLDGKKPVNGVNVIARNVANPFHDAVSALSGNFSRSDSPEDPQAGVYTLNGLTPGATYAVFVQRFDVFNFDRPGFIRRILPGPEEFHSGSRESTDPDRDDPAEFAPLVAVAGRPLTGKDIRFNRLAPGPVPVGDPRSVELLLPTPFDICGQRFDSVFLNFEQGNLTFGEPYWGSPNTVPIASAPLRHLPEPPIVAGLVTDLLTLFPGGTLTYEEGHESLTIRYTDVPAVNPDFSVGGPNTFAITLRGGKGSHANRVTLSYGDLDLRNGLAGYSCGSHVTSRMEPESDLSALAGRLIRGHGQPAIFEDFSDHDLDLDHLTLRFELPGAFTDRFEPNDTRRRAREVQLPFNTVEAFADITTGDVDFYRFRAKAGELLVAETAPGGALQTRLGLFGPGGSLLASSDGLLPFPSSFARIIHTIPADGDYTLAVGARDDVDFSGKGTQTGRYALSLTAYRGTILPLNGDDVTVEVPLRFTFPFNGANWESVWVSSNGNLTFGAPEPVSVVSDLQLPGFLGGPPRVAPLFTDLDPSGTFNGGLTGLVMAEEKAHSLTVHWVSVPYIFDSETNSFSVTLNSDGRIEMAWGAIMAADIDERGTIVGISPGNGAGDPGSIDLSRSRDLDARGTTYQQFRERSSRFFWQQFNVPRFDLSFDRLTFGARGRHDR